MEQIDLGASGGGPGLVEPPSERAAVAVQGAPQLTVEQTIALHRGEWILMKVSAFDQEGWPERGYLLAHSPRRGDISRALRREPQREDRAEDAPYEPYYIFRAFPRTRTDPSAEMLAALPDS